MSLSKLQELVMDRVAWYVTVMGSQKVGHDLVTEQQHYDKRSSIFRIIFIFTNCSNLFKEDIRQIKYICFKIMYY